MRTTSAKYTCSRQVFLQAQALHIYISVIQQFGEAALCYTSAFTGHLYSASFEINCKSSENSLN